ncbi:FUSC family protein [Vibrio sp. CK2-1]|uniref:FUSC family protein n=1 Tax=Vibrio sp. CK2-1 TaxID=2912249 RepID=UPI001F1C1D57|nr:FUSC family protein [Vibrio sp. CK2-1]MCF7353594.1 FUSC family protein [Vibrio sp. CK2-1]
MSFHWLDWSQTPWGKATAPQWRYAIRNALALTLALYVAFVLDLEQPYWALTSAAVVSFPTFGSVISKSLGRIFGSLLGAFATYHIVGHTLNDPWLFTFYMSLWMAICTYIASHYENNVSYAFQLAGYTAAIIGYTTVNSTDTHMLFEITQARVCEVVVGILCSGVMMMILPSTSDGVTLISTLRQMQSQLLEHFELLSHPESYHPDAHNKDLHDKIRLSHETVIGKILSMNLLRVQAYWSHYQLRYQDSYLNHLLQQQLQMTSHISSLRRMLVNWPNPPENLSSVLLEIQQGLQSGLLNQYSLAQKLALIKPTRDDDFRHHAFWVRLCQFCKLYLRCADTLHSIENMSPGHQRSLGVVPKRSRIRRHTDNTEALYNGLRTFVCLVTCSWFWINSQWDMGAGAATLAAVSCLLNSTSPAPMVAITTMFRSVLWLCVAVFILKFGILLQISTFGPFAILLILTVITMELKKLQSVRNAGLWGILIVFMGTFIAITNPPTYDYQSFVNTCVSMIVGILFSAVAFHVFKPSSDRRKGLRIAKSLRRDVLTQLSSRSGMDHYEFESLVYNRVNRLSQSKDQCTRLGLLRLGVVTLNCQHAVYQLKTMHSAKAAETLQMVESNLYQVYKSMKIKQAWFIAHNWEFHYSHDEVQLQQSLNSLMQLSESLASEGQIALSGVVWRLYCSLLQLQQVNVADDGKSLELKTQS